MSVITHANGNAQQSHQRISCIFAASLWTWMTGRTRAVYLTRCNSG